MLICLDCEADTKFSTACPRCKGKNIGVFYDEEPDLLVMPREDKEPSPNQVSLLRELGVDFILANRKVSS